MSRKAKSKVVTFTVRLTNVGPESKKRLMAAGLNAHLELATYNVEFKDTEGRGFDSPMFAVSVMEKQDELLRNHVECVVVGEPPKKRGKRG